MHMSEFQNTFKQDNLVTLKPQFFVKFWASAADLQQASSLYYQKCLFSFFLPMSSMLELDILPQNRNYSSRSNNVLNFNHLMWMSSGWADILIFIPFKSKTEELGSMKALGKDGHLLFFIHLLLMGKTFKIA